MSNAETFIDKYKQLEEVVRSTYGLDKSDSISYYLSKENRYQRYRNEISYCQDVRNLIQHKQKLGDGFAVLPSQQMMDFIDRLISQIKNRPRCHDIQIKIKDVYWQTVDGSVKETMRMMREKVYTHVPILDNGRVIGVFDENSIFNYLADEEIIAIEDGLTVSDMKKYISIEGRDMEEFIFYSATSYVEELESEFDNAFRQGKRVGLAFITSTGKAHEDLQGIITPWDILGTNK